MNYTWEYPVTLVPGIFLRRYKRFLVDIQLQNGEVVIAHCTNSGSMESCLETGAEVFLSPATDLARKTRFTWEMIKINQRWVGINTGIPNILAYEMIKGDILPQFSGYTLVQREKTFQDSRFDVYAAKEGEKCFIEVKNVTYKQGNAALFPDAVTIRGQKHLQTLIEAKKSGYRAVMLYIIQRTDVEVFGPAVKIDPDYTALLIEAIENGVEVTSVQVEISPDGISLYRELPLKLN